MNSSEFTVTNLRATLDLSTAQGVALFAAIGSDQQSIIDFRCSMMSPRFRQLLDCPADATGQSFRQFTPIAEQQALFEQFRDVLTQQQQAYCRATLLQTATQSGQVYELTLIPLSDGVLVTASPAATPMQPVEQVSRLQVLENSFNACLNGITVYEAVLDTNQELIDFRFVAINEAGLTINGLSREQVIGKTLRELYPPTDSFGLYATYRQVYLTHETHQGEHFYPDYGIWRQVVIVRISGGVMVTYQDITLQKQLQTEQQQLIEELITHAPGGALLLEPVMDKQQLVDLRVVRCNETYAQLRRKSAAELSGQLIGQLAPGWQSTPLYAHVRQVLLTGEVYQGSESRAIDGRLRYATFRLVRAGTFLLVTYEDQTQHRQDQQHLDMLAQDLNRLTHNIQEFAFVASHDLQEPLRKIQQLSDLLVSKYGERIGDGRVYLDRMQQAANRLSGSLKALLGYSRLTVHQQKKEPVSITTVINKALIRLETAIHRSGARVEVEPLPTIHGDASQLEQLFEQLIANSIKFVGSGKSPHIRIGCESVAGGQLPAQLQTPAAAADYCCIRVSDEGIGFEQKYAERIFGIFQRLHGQHHYPGTGIGLAICQRVAFNHKGLITASSQPGKGADFRVYLPV
ncbi:PAS domain-containing protein [uncultured Spirosoma sp.]|uniref:sensor histidine kinase n=1 Tax=uncultured Spirosoma sp. TaxID=278208 RepID=UPI0025898667|nr:PAS domain-containing protein [uncultured Spirosoma sp.]